MLNRFHLFPLYWNSETPLQNYRHAGYITPSDTRWTLRSDRTRCSTPRAVRNAKLNAFSELQFAGCQVWFKHFQLLQLHSTQVFCPPFWLPVMGTSCGSFFFSSIPLLSSPSIYLCINCILSFCVIYCTVTAAFAAHTWNPFHNLYLTRTKTFRCRCTWLMDVTWDLWFPAPKWST